MKILFRLSLLASVVFFSACSGENTSTSTFESAGSANEPTQVEQQTSVPAQAEQPTDPPIQLRKQNNAPAQPAPANNNAQAALNPPHGQPGHDCGIPVGAPLNSAAPNNTQPQAPSQANDAVALNPPHGQPGHDCGVPVGAPLNQ